LAVIEGFLELSTGGIPRGVRFNHFSRWGLGGAVCSRGLCGRLLGREGESPGGVEVDADGI
jgi:hypothetical protein